MHRGYHLLSSFLIKKLRNIGIYMTKKTTNDTGKYSSDSSILDIKEKKSRIYQIY